MKMEWTSVDVRDIPVDHRRCISYQELLCIVRWSQDMGFRYWPKEGGTKTAKERLLKAYYIILALLSSGVLALLVFPQRIRVVSLPNMRGTVVFQRHPHSEQSIDRSQSLLGSNLRDDPGGCLILTPTAVNGHENCWSGNGNLLLFGRFREQKWGFDKELVSWGPCGLRFEEAFKVVDAIGARITSINKPRLLHYKFIVL